VKSLSSKQKVALINRVFQTTCESTESFEPNNIGLDLAYLAWAISDNSFVSIHSESASYRLFSAIFPKKDLVWKFIEVY